jgi:hypothetical protein
MCFYNFLFFYFFLGIKLEEKRNVKKCQDLNTKWMPWRIDLGLADVWGIVWACSEVSGELNEDDERLADFRLKCHTYLLTVIPGFD